MLTLLYVFNRARKVSCDHGEKLGGVLSSIVPLFGRGRSGVLRGSEMIEAWPSVVVVVLSEVVEVLWRSRFRARSRASSNAAAEADVRALLLLVVVMDGESWIVLVELLVSASSAL